MNKWSAEASRIIHKIMVEHHPTDPKEFRRLAHDAYPFGPRAYEPYERWCTEVTRQARLLGEPRPKPLRDYWMQKAE